MPRAPALASSTYFTNRSRSLWPTSSCHVFQVASSLSGLRSFCSSLDQCSLSWQVSLPPDVLRTPLPYSDSILAPSSASSLACCGSSGDGWAWNLSSVSWRRVSGSSLAITGSNLRAVLTILVDSTLSTSPALAAAASCSGVRSVALAHWASDASTLSLRSTGSASATNFLASATSAASGSGFGCFSTFSGAGSGGAGVDLLHAAVRIRTNRMSLRTAALYPLGQPVCVSAGRP